MGGHEPAGPGTGGCAPGAVKPIAFIVAAALGRGVLSCAVDHRHIGPTPVAVSPSRVVRYAPRLFRHVEEAIGINQVASVSVDSGPTGRVLE